MTVAHYPEGYAFVANMAEGIELSPQLGGRILQLLASSCVHKASSLATTTFVAKGQAVVCGNITGVATGDESLTQTYIGVDTGGIYGLAASGVGDDGNSAIAIGDNLYINNATAVISKISNPLTQKFFGRALSTANSASTTTLVAIQLHQGLTPSELTFGTSAAPLTSSEAGHIFTEMRSSDSAASGTARNLYSQLTIATTGGAGEATRSRTMVPSAVVAGTEGVHGAHDTLEFGATGSGAGGLFCGHRGNIVMSGGIMGAGVGQFYGGMSEIYGTASGTLAAAADSAIHAFSLSGDATAAQTVVNVFSFTGLKVGSGAGDHVNTACATVTDGLKCKINGTLYYIALCSAAS
jgi:hypothetical protein